MKSFSFLYLTTSLIVFAASALALHCQSVPISALKAETKTRYVVRLTNGDILTGAVSKIQHAAKRDSERESAITLQTSVGDVTLYESEIAEIAPLSSLYRHSHRVFIMPTAEPIGSNHFLGVWELLLLYGGVGVGDFLSITAGRTIVPTVASEEQGSVVNAKATLYSADLDDAGNRARFALGANFAFANANNQIANLYGALTFTGSRSSITALAFAKVGGADAYRVRARDWINVSFPYESGSFGVGVGLDTRFSDRHDLRFIGELWNGNLSRITNTAVLLGLRLANTAVSMDFGITVFTAQPALFPCVSFAWTPF